jgi:hypothetical protein
VLSYGFMAGGDPFIKDRLASVGGGLGVIAENVIRIGSHLAERARTR